MPEAPPRPGLSVQAGKPMLEAFFLLKGRDMNGQSEGADSVLTDEIRRRLLKGTGTAAGAVAFYPLFSAGSAMAASNGSGVSGAQYVYVGTYTGALCQCGFGLRASGFGPRLSAYGLSPAKRNAGRPGTHDQLAGTGRFCLQFRQWLARAKGAVAVNGAH